MADEQTFDTAQRQFWKSFHGSGWRTVPGSIAECPECSKTIVVMSHAYDEETNQPIGSALQIECVDDESGHRYWQSDWQPVVESVRKWCGASDD
jgi:hypothetical protein